MNVPGWTYFHGLYAVHQKMVHSTSPPCSGTVSTCRIHWPVLGHWHLSNLCVFSQWTLRFPHEKLTQFSHWTKFQQTLARGLIVLRSRTIVIHFFDMLTPVPYEQVHTVITFWLCSKKSVLWMLFCWCSVIINQSINQSINLSRMQGPKPFWDSMH